MSGRHCLIDPSVEPYKHLTKAVRLGKDWLLVLCETKTQFLVALKGQNLYLNKNQFEEEKVLE